MTEEQEEIVIPKENAVFWMDAKGRWKNKHGAFEHAKIINYFNSAIQRDQQGYYLSQINDDTREKVYFRYEDTALFVFDVIDDDDVTLVLNTGKRIKLQPESLTIKNDNLYMQDGEDRIKFAERGLLKISERMEDEGDQYFINVNGKRYKIEQRR